MKISYNNFHSFSVLEERTFVSKKGIKFIWEDTGICFEDQKVYLRMRDPKDDELHFICIDELDDFTLIMGDPITE